jgi:hypothetical protein
MRNMIREVNADPARKESYLENAHIADHGSDGAVGLGIRIVRVFGSFGGGSSWRSRWVVEGLREGECA